MKLFKTSLPLFIALIGMIAISATVSSCKKDDPPALTTLPAEKAVVSNIFFPGAFNIIVSGSGGYEYGLKFGVLKAGQITKLGCKMPTAGTYRVTLWDASVTPAVVIVSSNVVQSVGQTPTFNSITSAPVAVGKDYFVTIWSNTNWNQITPAGGGNIAYPITTAGGNVQIKGYSWISAATSTPIKFPTNVDNSYVAGVADFEYQADPF